MSPILLMLTVWRLSELTSHQPQKKVSQVSQSPPLWWRQRPAVARGSLVSMIFLLRKKKQTRWVNMGKWYLRSFFRRVLQGIEKCRELGSLKLDDDFCRSQVVQVKWTLYKHGLHLVVQNSDFQWFRLGKTCDYRAMLYATRTRNS